MKKSHQNEIWVGTEELNQDPEFLRLSQQEFEDKNVAETLADASESSLKANRRDFLKFLGFGLGAATVAASCDIPVKKAMPYVIKPDEIVPGVATYYASSFVQGGDYCSVLVKTREGRPIKIEGNTLSGVTNGGTSARAQASVLSLYDNNRIQNPGTIENGKVTKMSWEDLDKEVMAKLNAGGAVRILANTVMSPSTKKVFADFQAKYPGAEVVMYDAVSSSAMLEANQESFGQAVIPDYHFDKAEVIVSVGADFLGTWISPVEYSGQYIKNRKVEGKGAKMSRHIQVESTMSLTGSNADNRILIKPSEQGAAIAALYNAVAAKTGGSSVSAPKLNEKAAGSIRKAADELVAARGKSLVVSGSNNVGEQVLVNAINNLLGNYGATIQMAHTSNQRQGMDKDVQKLVADMTAGSVGVLFVMDGANPVFDLPNGAAVAEAMSKVPTRVYMGSSMNETGAACTHAAPPHHLLESWGDVEPKKGHYSLVQPTIAPLFNTRQAESSFLTWAGGNADYFEYVKANWQAN
ncbi:MAG: TAT-variant-translocated molybdopterin oxidoreductase, partial [Saprospiraceae bacterium]|nr:TAT-variant-translocated molybdopterin oxidoreductase [Saprospiraceae bacterium]